MKRISERHGHPLPGTRYLYDELGTPIVTTVYLSASYSILVARVARVKSRLFGSNEESIAMSKIASVHISTGVFWAEIVIESTGGTDPITSHGHRKADAQRVRDLIEAYQAQSRG